MNFVVLRFMVMRVIFCVIKIRISGKKKYRNMIDMLYVCGEILFLVIESFDTSDVRDYVIKIIIRYFVLVYERCFSG